MKEEIGVEDFLQEWQARGGELAEVYDHLRQKVEHFGDISWTFVPRPGVSYSLRPAHKKPQERSFFAIMDVIDDDPDDRWLSICFYGDMITDPEQCGNLVPGGLGGADGYCFDLYENDSVMISYLEKRLLEAYRSAGEM